MKKGLDSRGAHYSFSKGLHSCMHIHEIRNKTAAKTSSSTSYRIWPAASLVI